MSLRETQDVMKPLSGTAVCAFFAGTSLLLFVASLFQDGFYIDREDSDAWANCLGLLLIGWIVIFQGVFAWLANPTLLMTWSLMCSRTLRPLAAIWAIVPLGFSLSFLLHSEILTSEAGHYSKITGYGTGYWLWVGSIATAFVGCIVGLYVDWTQASAIPASINTSVALESSSSPGDA
jgi:hypothetical protein